MFTCIKGFVKQKILLPRVSTLDPLERTVAKFLRNDAVIIPDLTFTSIKCSCISRKETAILSTEIFFSTKGVPAASEIQLLAETD